MAIGWIPIWIIYHFLVILFTTAIHQFRNLQSRPRDAFFLLCFICLYLASTPLRFGVQCLISAQRNLSDGVWIVFDDTGWRWSGQLLCKPPQPPPLDWLWVHSRLPQTLPWRWGPWWWSSHWCSQTQVCSLPRDRTLHKSGNWQTHPTHIGLLLEHRLSILTFVWFY